MGPRHKESQGPPLIEGEARAALKLFSVAFACAVIGEVAGAAHLSSGQLDQARIAGLCVLLLAITLSGTIASMALCHLFLGIFRGIRWSCLSVGATILYVCLFHVACGLWTISSPMHDDAMEYFRLEAFIVHLLTVVLVAFVAFMAPKMRSTLLVLGSAIISQVLAFAVTADGLPVLAESLPNLGVLTLLLVVITYEKTKIRPARIEPIRDDGSTAIAHFSPTPVLPTGPSPAAPGTTEPASSAVPLQEGLSTDRRLFLPLELLKELATSQGLVPVVCDMDFVLLESLPATFTEGCPQLAPCVQGQSLLCLFKQQDHAQLKELLQVAESRHSARCELNLENSETRVILSLFPLEPNQRYMAWIRVQVVNNMMVQSVSFASDIIRDSRSSPRDETPVPAALAEAANPAAPGSGDNLASAVVAVSSYIFQDSRSSLRDETPVPAALSEAANPAAPGSGDNLASAVVAFSSYVLQDSSPDLLPNVNASEVGHQAAPSVGDSLASPVVAVSSNVLQASSADLPAHDYASEVARPAVVAWNDFSSPEASHAAAQDPSRDPSPAVNASKVSVVSSEDFAEPIPASPSLRQSIRDSSINRQAAAVAPKESAPGNEKHATHESSHQETPMTRVRATSMLRSILQNDRQSSRNDRASSFLMSSEEFRQSESSDASSLSFCYTISNNSSASNRSREVVDVESQTELLMTDQGMNTDVTGVHLGFSCTRCHRPPLLPGDAEMVNCAFDLLHSIHGGSRGRPRSRSSGRSSNKSSSKLRGSENQGPRASNDCPSSSSTSPQQSMETDETPKSSPSFSEELPAETPADTDRAKSMDLRDFISMNGEEDDLDEEL